MAGIHTGRRAGKAPILMRAGLPLVGGQMLAHARRRGYPLMISANAFSKRYPVGHPQHGSFRGFRTDLKHLEGLDIALDSCGFVASWLYGGFPWSIRQYCELAASRDWTWASAPDLCCEPQIASDKAMRLLRIAGTARLYSESSRIMAELGGAPLVPILQGWTPAEYRLCYEWMPVVEWPDLVGLGSVCRRHVHGPDGLLAILDEVDSFLPPNVKVHAFGIKSSALKLILGEERYRRRVASADSQSWDFAARASRRVNRTMDHRLKHLDAWMERQDQEQQNPVRPERSAPDPRMERIKQTVRDIAGRHLADCILNDVLEYDDARGMLDRSACWATAYAHQHGLDAEVDEAEVLQWLEDTPI